MDINYLQNIIKNYEENLNLEKENKIYLQKRLEKLLLKY